MNAFEPRSPMYEGNELTAVPKSTFFILVSANLILPLLDFDITIYLSR